MNDKPQNSETPKNDALKNSTSKATPENSSNSSLCCEIVQDLLPSYMDKLTSKITNEAVERHLDGCKTCTEKIRRMQKAENIANTEIPAREIDYLKTVKKKTKKKIFLSVTAVLVAVLFAIGLKLFVIGDELSPQEVSCQVHMSIAGKVQINEIICLSSAKNITDISYVEEEGGVLRITFRGVLTSPFTAQGKLPDTYEAQNRIERIYLGDQIIWDDEQDISPRISAVYQARHAYVGDMPANEKSVQALGMREMLGDFESELQTSAEPYGWKIILKSSVHISDIPEAETRMKAYAALLMATIDNLGYVTYEYEVETYISELEEKTLTMTTKDVEELYGLRHYIPIFKEDGTFDHTEPLPWEGQEWSPAELQSILIKAKLDGGYRW
jgi:hypothetical protein